MAWLRSDCDRPKVYPYARRLSATVNAPNTARPPGICEIPICTRWSAPAKVTSSPWKWTEPPLGAATPEMARRSVVLPAPLVPSSATISPSATEKETLKRTCT